MSDLPEMLARRKVGALVRRARELMAREAYEDGLKAAQQAYKTARRSLSPETPEFMLALNSLAALNMHLGHFGEADAILRTVVDGPPLPETEEAAAACNNLSVCCMRRGRQEEAVPYMERAVAIKRKIFNTKPVHYLENLQDLALLLGRLGRDAEALPHFDEICTILAAEVGEEDAMYASALQNLAIALAATGQTAKSKEMKRKAEEIIRGEPKQQDHSEAEEDPLEDPDVQKALALYEQGRTAEAQALQRRVVARLPDLPLPGIVQQTMGHLLDPFMTLAAKLDKAGYAAESRGDLDAAANDFERVIAILATSLSTQHPTYLGALNNLAQVRRKQRRYDEAKGLFRTALTPIERLAEDEAPKSLIAANAAVLFSKIADESAPDPSSSNFSFDEVFKGKPSDYTVSMRVRFPTPIDGEPAVSKTMRWLDARAKFYESLGAFEKAMLLYRLSIELCGMVRGEDHPDLIEPLDTLVLIEIGQGLYAEAEGHLSKAIAIAEEASGRARMQLGYLLQRKATLLSSMGQDAAAEAPMLRAVEIMRKAASPQQLEVFEENLAVLWLKLKRADSARPILDRILANCDVDGLEESDPARLQQLATFADALGEHDRALGFYEASMRGQQKKTGEWTVAFARTLSNYGTALRMIGKWEEAERQYRRAVEIRRVLFGNDHQDLVESLIRLALTLAALDRGEEALAAAEEALDIGGRITGRLSAMSSEAFRLNLTQRQLQHLGIALSIVTSLLASIPSAVSRAYRFVLRRKALAGQALVVQRNAILGGRYPHLVHDLRELDRLRTEIVAIAQAASRKKYQRLLQEAYEARSAMETSLAREIKEMMLEAPLSATDVPAVARALPKGAVLVEFVDLEPYNFKAVLGAGEPEKCPRRYIAFILPANAPEALSLVDLGDAGEIDLLVRSEMQEEVGKKRSGRIEGGSGITTNSRLLFERLVKPITASIGPAKQILLVPDGNLFLVAFDSLPLENDRLVIDEFEISYLGTGRDALRFASPSSEELSKPVIVAAPDFDLAAENGQSAEHHRPDTTNKGRAWLRNAHDLIKPLPHTLTEGRRIQKLIPDAILMEGRKALEGAVKRLKRPRIVHFATHGFAQASGKPPGETNSAMLWSGLVLAGANSFLLGRPPATDAEDGILTAEDVATIDLIDTEIAVLSACETAVGDVLNGEGVFGLRRAFSVAGTRSIVMSLWQVPDAETEQLMIAFYDGLLRGLSKPAALRAAKLEVRRSRADPFFWDAFICEGDWNPLRLASIPAAPAD